MVIIPVNSYRYTTLVQFLGNNKGAVSLAVDDTY